MQNQNTLRHPSYIYLKQQINNCCKDSIKLTTLDIIRERVKLFYEETKGTEYACDAAEIMLMFINKRDEIDATFKPCRN